MRAGVLEILECVPGVVDHVHAGIDARAGKNAGNCNEHMPENAKSNNGRFGRSGACGPVRGGERTPGARATPDPPTDLRFPIPIGVGDRPSRVAGPRPSCAPARAPP